MEKESRTYKSLKNAQVALIYYFVQLILGFWSRKVFFDYLGSEIVGLDTTVVSLLGFLNLAELGIGTSVSFFLYKPLFEKDYETIRKIVYLQGWLYRRVAFIIFCLSCILMLFFPRIFSDTMLPIGYSYAIFLVSLFGTLVGYIFNYNQIILSADQKTYKVTRINQGIQALFKILLIACLPIVDNPFLLYLSTNLFAAIAGSVVLRIIIKKEYSWQQNTRYNGQQLLKEYGAIITKTKQAFVHQIGAVALTQLSPIIMYSFTSLTIIAYYGNYLLIVNKLVQLINSVFGSTSAAVGNLVASKDKDKMIRVFWELYDSRFCLAWIVIFILYIIVEPFITLWLGAEFILGPTVLLLLMLLNSITLTRTAVDMFKNAFGMFADVWAPLAETTINLSLSICFGYFWGINGVLTGVVISQIVIVCLWRPFYLFKDGFKIPTSQYFIPTLWRYIVVFSNFIFIYMIKNTIFVNVNCWLSLIQKSLFVFPIISIIMAAEFFLFTQGFRDFALRIHCLLCDIRKKQ